ncbi:ferritin heavy chain-like [Sturnira hondurensis]|uniref:ferritin heavy chain-like n=1 Tax=Sturnira hondurensis TaxID=192404 RepID=UPI001879A6CD|nr:ferritin heavy chain-like [Sturnira hondurensis]
MGFCKTHKYSTGHDSDVRLEISVNKGQVHQVLTTAASQRKLPGENRTLPGPAASTVAPAIAHPAAWDSAPQQSCSPTSVPEDMEVLPGPSFVHQNYHPECEAAVNNNINVHFHASYMYSSIAFYFDLEDLALRQLSQFFLQRSNKEKHSEGLMQLQNQCGDRIRLGDIGSPPWDEWESGLRAMHCALYLVKKVNQSLLSLHQLATEKGDGHLCHFLESHYLHQQVMFTKELGGHVMNLPKMGALESGLAESLFDKLTLSDRKN